MKNPFKLNNVISSAAALAIGGGANVLADYAIAQIGLSEENKKYVNAGKIVVGAVAGSMLSGKKYGWLKSAADGVAIVGFSNLIDGLVNDTTETTSGLPEGTIGRIRLGQRGFRPARSRRVAGLSGASFMEV